MKSPFYIILFLNLFFSISCQKNNCLKSAGAIEKETRLLEGFDKIQIFNYFKVYLKTDTINKIEIEAGGNLIKNIEADIVDSTLIIKDINTCGFIKGYEAKKIYISLRDIKSMVIEDGVELYSTDTLKLKNIHLRYLSDIGSCNLLLDCRYIYFDVWYGTGKYVFAGKTKSLRLGMLAMSSADASNLEADNVSAYSNSLGDIYINVKKKLNAEIKNDGNIYYKGEPTKITLIDSLGTGKLIHY